MPADPSARFIYLVRSGRDACVSFYHHLSHQAEADGGFDIDDAITYVFLFDAARARQAQAVAMREGFMETEWQALRKLPSSGPFAGA